MEYRVLSRSEIGKLAEIDRTEAIERMYYLRDGRLALVLEQCQVPDWSPKEKQRRVTDLERSFDNGCVFYGAFDGPALVGMAVLDPRPLGTGEHRLNLAGLWVTSRYRNMGVGKALFQQAVEKARELDAKVMYVSATPSENTVRFYSSLGCRLADPTDPDLLRTEPDDIHMELDLPCRQPEKPGA